MQSRSAVALLVETSNSYARGLLTGIVRYAKQHDRWTLFMPEQERGAPPPQWLSKWKGDGILARIETPEIAEKIRSTGLPVVDLSAARLYENIPWVETDDTEIATLAFNHLRERGFRQLAFCGDPTFNWSKWRKAAFMKMAEAAKCECQVFDALNPHAPNYSWSEDRQALTNWLKQLPHPTGIFACYDHMAQKILDICRELDLAVPEQLAVVGVDNDELLCNACAPSLSSVIPDPERTGYEAAELLDRMIRKEEVPRTATYIPPKGLMVRQSSDLFAIDDPLVAKALRLIRERACAGAKVQDILAEVDLSRRVLESRFKRITGKTPHDFLLRYRLERAKGLLFETNLGMLEVAEKSGFGHAEYMSEVFMREVGQRPGEFRRNSREDKD